MHVLVRFFTRRSRGHASHHDQTYTGARLTLGRGTDQDIHLPNLRVTLAHAELVESADGRVRLQAVQSSSFRHNGVAVQSVMLAVDDQIEIGPYRLTVVAQPGMDLALEIVDAAAGRGGEFEQAIYSRARLDLAANGLTRRRFALGLAGSLLGLLLILPLSGVLAPQFGNVLRNVPGVPSDHAWSPGTVSNAHAHFADQCERCHATPFVRVQNETCSACHTTTPHHVEADLLATGLFDGARCADCHHEHKPGGSIVRGDEGLCVACHGDLKRLVPATVLGDATHFGSDHPAFTPLASARSDPPGTNRATPGLAFSHRLHLDATGVKNAAGERVTLGCENCHEPEPGGGLMAPVAFEVHCNDCHRLRIPGEEGREIPHGDVPATLAGVADYFAAKALTGGYPNEFAPDVVRLRRRPGVELVAAERSTALAWAEEMSTLAIREMVAYTTCGVCHTAQATGKGGAEAWVLAPVGIPHAWLPKSRFSHTQHESMACADCHADVAQSESSADVLLPDIAGCRTCHGGADARAGRLASTCITCHDFHRASQARIATGSAGGD